MDVKVINSSPKKFIHKNVGEHIPSGFSMSTISSFKTTEDKHDECRGKDCMKKFCQSLREYAMKIIDFKYKKMK